jgi:hypothetical protein
LPLAGFDFDFVEHLSLFHLIEVLLIILIPHTEGLNIPILISFFAETVFALDYRAETHTHVFAFFCLVKRGVELRVMVRVLLLQVVHDLGRFRYVRVVPKVFLLVFNFRKQNRQIDCFSVLQLYVSFIFFGPKVGRKVIDRSFISNSLRSFALWHSCLCNM